MVSSKLLLVILFLNVLLTPSVGKADAEAEPTVIQVAFTTFDQQKGVPSGWELDRKSGKPVIRLIRTDDGNFLQLISDDQSSFGIKKSLQINIKDYPFLNWTWKVSKLPSGGDVRKSETDDQAAQIYIAFSSWESGFFSKLLDKWNTPVVGYLWDNEAPKDWMGQSSQINGSKLRCVVIRNRTDKLGELYKEKRNIYQDYQKLFKDLHGGEPAGPTVGISLYINSQHTKSSAESYIDNIYFSRQ